MADSIRKLIVYIQLFYMTRNTDMTERNKRKKKQCINNDDSST